ncbi:MAG: hypothetical protein J6S27_02090 [Thermoguttaceae bacterium]|nr:hypothetical protein [Thermoguttaceae bacterium]
MSASSLGNHESRAHADLEMLERMLVSAHHLCAEAVNLKQLTNSDLRNWHYSWCFVLERLIGEVAAQKKATKR